MALWFGGGGWCVCVALFLISLHRPVWGASACMFTQTLVHACEVSAAALPCIPLVRGSLRIARGPWFLLCCSPPGHISTESLSIRPSSSPSASQRHLRVRSRSQTRRLLVSVPLPRRLPGQCSAMAFQGDSEGKTSQLRLRAKVVALPLRSPWGLRSGSSPVN